MSRPNSWQGLIDSWDPQIQRAFLDAIYTMRNAAQIDQIARMLEAGDVDGALRAVGLDPIAFRGLERTVNDAFEAGGNATANIIPVAQDAAGFRTVFQFSVRNPAAERWLRDHSANLVTSILDDQRQMIRGVLTDAMAKGLNPKTAALDLVGRVNKSTGRREGGAIGLTDSQETWVRSYADDLSSDKPTQALTRALRDKRFDAAVTKAEAKGEPIPPDLLGKMVTTYRNRALRYRAETIARSEAITALHTAQDQALDQAVASGAVNVSAITETWRSAGDGKVRDAHRNLNGQKIRRGGVFQSTLGPIRYPGDPSASVANTANCRCYLVPSVDFLAGLT